MASSSPTSTWIMGTTAVAIGNCAMAPSAKPATTAAAWRLMEIRFLQMNWGRTLFGDNGGQIYTLCKSWKYQTRYVYPKVCVCVCACRTASLVSEKCTNRSPTTKFIEQLRPRKSYFALTHVSVTVSNNARLNSASVGSQASAASGSWRTEGWNPRMIWLMVENPISLTQYLWWVFEHSRWLPGFQPSI